MPLPAIAQQISDNKINQIPIISVELTKVYSEDTKLNLVPQNFILLDKVDIRFENVKANLISKMKLDEQLNLNNHLGASFINDWLIVKLENSTNSPQSVYFYCGRHKAIRLYNNEDSIVQYGGMSDYHLTTSKYFPTYYFPLKIKPLSKQTYFVSICNYGIVSDKIESNFYFSSIDPRLKRLESGHYFTWLTVSVLISGGILLMCIFIFMQFLTFRKREYLFYSLYAGTMFLNMERALEWNFQLRFITNLFPNYFYSTAVPINILAGIFYLLFTYYYFDLKHKSPPISKLIRNLIIILFSGLLMLLTIECASIRTFYLMNVFRLFTFIPILFATLIALVVYNKLERDLVRNYYLYGSLFLFAGALSNVVLNRISFNFNDEYYPRVIFLSIGVLIEIGFFAMGLATKSVLAEKREKEQEIENLKLQQAHSKQVLSIREKLSRDLHDDIGSTLSSINILSRTAHANLELGQGEKTSASLEKINERSQRLLSNMSDIIWNINPNNDSVDEMLSRMREYATTILEAKNIEYSIDFDGEVKSKISIDNKSNLYLIFKEAVNNLSKYSGCTHAKIILNMSDKKIYMCIEDNGKGFDMNELDHRGGIANMQHRADDLKATLSITSVIGKGTKIELTV